MKKWFAFLVLAIALMQSGVVFAASHLTSPLLVIRFNQPKVHYKQSLYTAVGRAVKIKPNVTFNVVSRVPSVGGGRQDWMQVAARHSEEVRQTLVGMGIPQSSIMMSRQFVANIGSDEVFLFVR